MNINNIFGKFINGKRKAKGLSQEFVSAKVKISRSTLAKIESGESSPSLENSKTILDFFNLKFSDFEDFLESQDLESKINKSLKSTSDREKILKQIEEL